MDSFTAIGIGSNVGDDLSVCSVQGQAQERRPQPKQLTLSEKCAGRMGRRNDVASLDLYVPKRLQLNSKKEFWCLAAEVYLECSSHVHDFKYVHL